MSNVPAAIFFKPGYQLVSRLVNYKAIHKQHGLIKGPPPKTKKSFLQFVKQYI